MEGSQEGMVAFVESRLDGDDRLLLTSVEKVYPFCQVVVWFAESSMSALAFVIMETTGPGCSASD